MPLLPAGEMTRMRSVLAERANARLKKIRAPGVPNRSGDTAPGADLWVGDAPCYLERVRLEAKPDGVQNPGFEDALTVLDGEVNVQAIAGPDWEASVLTVEDRRVPAAPVTKTFRVKGGEHVAFNLLDSARLVLDEVVT